MNTNLFYNSAKKATVYFTVIIFTLNKYGMFAWVI